MAKVKEKKVTKKVEKKVEDTKKCCDKEIKIIKRERNIITMSLFIEKYLSISFSGVGYDTGMTGDRCLDIIAPEDTAHSNRVRKCGDILPDSGLVKFHESVKGSADIIFQFVSLYQSLLIFSCDIGTFNIGI